MPRIMSIARRRPARSSVLRCSVTSGGDSSVRAVSVAIWRFLSLRVSVRRPGSPGGAPFRAAGSPLALGVDGAIQPIPWGFTLDASDGRVREVAAAALAVARSVAMARVRRADHRRCLPRRPAAVPGEGTDAIGAFLVAGFFNLLAVALLAPAFGWLLRRRRRDLPFMIARDYAGTALLVLTTCGLLAGGLVHRSAVIEERADQR